MQMNQKRFNSGLSDEDDCFNFESKKGVNKMKAEVFIRDVWFKNCSVNGNPSYFVDMDFDNGCTEYAAYTGSDCACGYGMEQHKGKKISIDYHYTKKGKCVITDVY